jgi:hypothetical protein
MFRDPRVLEKDERLILIDRLRDCVAMNPTDSDLRVLYGMALCVDSKVQEAIEEFREGVRLAPQSYIAHLKMGELWMRLRVCGKAEEHTHRAAQLAGNMVQSDLARKQGATIRTMMREGIERGGYQGPWTLLSRLIRPRRQEAKAGQTAPALDGG